MIACRYNNFCFVSNCAYLCHPGEIKRSTSMSFVDGNLGTWPKEKRFVILQSCSYAAHWRVSPQGEEIKIKKSILWYCQISCLFPQITLYSVLEIPKSIWRCICSFFLFFSVKVWALWSVFWHPLWQRGLCSRFSFLHAWHGQVCQHWRWFWLQSPTFASRNEA